MKRIIFLLLLSNISFAQVPSLISHRGTAYYTNGTVLSNGVYHFKVSIKSGSPTGADEYVEIHHPVEITNGQYSLKIGNGIAQGSGFSSINWAEGNKYLVVAYDPTGATNYTISGSSQLMSVPYAFMSNNTLNNIEIIDNINALRSKTGKPNQVVYIRKHTLENDGGEGFFFWRPNVPPNNVRLNDNDGTIIRIGANNTSTGAWIRSIEGRINVNFFGTYGNSQLTDGARIQKAIDFAYDNQFQWGETNAGSTVYIPTGKYVIPDKLVLKSGVNIEGENIQNTLLVANNDTKKDGAMIEITEGQVISANVSNLTLLGDAPATPDTSSPITKHCFSLVAKKLGSDGGLWASTFKNILIKGFNGIGILLQGGGINSRQETDAYLRVNQGLIFESVSVIRQRHESNGLLIQGQHGQLTFINCGFDGLEYGTTTDKKTTKYFNVAIDTNGVQASVIKFLTCTFQYSEYGALIKYGENITFDNCWFENLDIGVSVQNSISYPSRGVNILNCRFANASGFGSLWSLYSNRNGAPNGASGTCISVEGSQVNIHNNYVTVSNYQDVNSNNFFIRNYGNDSHINANNNSFENVVLSKTYGIISNNSINVTSNTIDVSGYKFVSVNSLLASNITTNIKEIRSNLSAGEMITVKATGTGQIKFDNSRNIIFAKNTVTPTTPFILNPKETATFLKTDIGIGPINGVYYNETWQLVHANKTY